MKKKPIDIVSILLPDANVLNRDSEGTIIAEIMDAELDGIGCKFNNDDCV